MTTLRQLKRQRAETAERQRRAGVSLADNIRMLRSPVARDLFEASRLVDIQDSLLDRIEDLTQQLLELDERIERHTKEVEKRMITDKNIFTNTTDY